jgi:hypothetical protein
MRMGIGIGWPNASASNTFQGVYFAIESICEGDVLPGYTTQLVDNSLYQSGDFVDFEINDQTGRLALEDIVETIGDTVFNISGQIYTGCPA